VAKELLAVRQIAELIQRPREDLITVVDRIRGWTDVGLLKVAGARSPGTGRKRMYEPSAIIDALVMTALTDVGLAAIRVAAAADMIVLGFGRQGACDILDPAKPERPGVFLVTSGPVPNPWRVSLAYNDTKLGALAPNEPYSIIIKLNDYFRPLQGKVTAVWEHGGANIDLAARRKA
jgi:hypothetical protein